MAFTSLKKAVQDKLKKSNNFKRGVTQVKVCELAQQVIQDLVPDLFDQIDILDFKQSKLMVKVSNPALAQELKLNEAKITEQINQKLNQGEVEKIVFKTNKKNE